MGLIRDDDFPVLRSVERVVERARRVRFHREAVAPAVEAWGHLLPGPSEWAHPCHYFDGSAASVRWIFVLDLLNHCFWPDPGAAKWKVDYAGGNWDGYWALAGALKRAMEEGIPITDAAFMAGITAGELANVLAGNERIPLFEERLRNLREAGEVLLERWWGDALHLVEEAGGSAPRLARLVVDSFASFRDEAVYEGAPVCLWKRAQILAADLFQAFGGEKWGAFVDVDRLTAFADYKLPQVLRELGIISYDGELAQLIDGRTLIEPGGAEEVEIRAMTLHAVEELKGAFRAAGREVNSMRVDNWLWRLGQLEPFRGRPYHLCRTIFY